MSLKWYTFKIHSGTLSHYYIQPLKPKSGSNGKAVEHIPVEKEMRPTNQDREVIVRMKSEGACANSIASALGVSVRTYHNYVDKLGLRK